MFLWALRHRAVDPTSMTTSSRCDVATLLSTHLAFRGTAKLYKGLTGRPKGTWTPGLGREPDSHPAVGQTQASWPEAAMGISFTALQESQTSRTWLRLLVQSTAQKGGPLELNEHRLFTRGQETSGQIRSNQRTGDQAATLRSAKEAYRY